MAKLNVNTAGRNAGETYAVKMVPVASIIVDPQLSRIFHIHDDILSGVIDKMVRIGFDRSEPLALWGNVLVDGHTRLLAAKKTGQTEVPVVQLDFASMEEAIIYCIERQRLRRNLTQGEILMAARAATKQGRDGGGRAAEQVAERIGVAPSTIYRARKIIEEAPLETAAIDKGEKTINEVYRTLKKPKPKPEPVPPPSPPDTQNELPGIPQPDTSPLTVPLKKAVEVLVEADELNAARLLVGEFVDEDNKEEFLTSLIVQVHDRLFQKEIEFVE